MVELVCRAEIAKRLGLSARRLRALIDDPAECFPDAVGRAAHTDLWEWDAVAGWAGDDTGERPAVPRSGAQGKGANSLPQPNDTFVDREAAVATVARLAEGEPLVTLAGPPGVGKTRLAVEVVRAHGRRWPDGNWFVPLAKVSDPALVPATIARVMDIGDAPGRSPCEALVARLKGSRAIIILDNCEHVAPACAAVADELLAACGGVHILATSRAPLGARGERVWTVPHLDTPPAAGVSSSERLFRVRAAANLPKDEETVDAIQEIARRLDGLPLAIEMAAAWTAVLSPVQIAARLDDRFRLLTAPNRGVVSHHLTLRAAVDWSYDLLSEAERALFRRLSVFAGGCALDAVEPVCCGDGLDPADVLPGLATLISRSLVVADTGRTPARYHMVETLRDYASQRLQEEDEKDAVWERFRTWTRSLVATAEAELAGPQQAAWFERLETEHDNIRAVLGALIAQRRSADALELAAALPMFWRVRRHLTEGHGWLRSGLDLAADDSVPDRVLIKALFGLGLLGAMLGRLQPAIESLEESADIAARMGDTTSQARALLTLGGACRMAARHDEALDYLRRTVELARRAGDAWTLAHSLGLSGEVHLARGEPLAARPFFEQSFVEARGSGDLQSLRVATNGLGACLIRLGDHQRAETLLTEGLDVGRRLGECLSIATTLGLLGELAARQGRYLEAEELLRSALALDFETSSPPALLGDLCRLGRLALRQGDLNGARDYLAQARSFGLKSGFSTASVPLALAELSLAENEIAAARQFVDEAITIGRQSGEDTSVALEVAAILAQATRQAGDLRRAWASLHDLFEAQRGTGDQFRMCACLEALGGVAAGLDRAEQAARLLGAADALRRRGGYMRYALDEAAYEADVATVRRALGERFDAVWAEGAALSVDEVAAYVGRRQGRRVRNRPPTGWDSLTKSERRVVELMAEGLTNSQIAERLFVSVRTVESHLYEVYAKLGVSSRIELARQAFERNARKDS